MESIEGELFYVDFLPSEWREVIGEYLIKRKDMVEKGGVYWGIDAHVGSTQTVVYFCEGEFCNQIFEKEIEGILRKCQEAGLKVRWFRIPLSSPQAQEFLIGGKS